MYLPTRFLTNALLAAPTPAPAPAGGGGNLVGPSCGLPSAVTDMASVFVGWEKGFLVITIIIGLFACLIMWGLGTAFNWRHVAEAGQKGILILLMIAAAAACITGVAAVLLAYVNC